MRRSPSYLVWGKQTDPLLPCSPDKNPNDSVVADRFARLGTIAAILRDAEKRKR